MIAAIQTAEVLTSILHAITFSIAMARLAVLNPVAAILITGVGCLSIAILTGTIVFCEFAKWYVRRYLRKRELEEQTQEPSGLERSGDQSVNHRASH
jgi:hypothetical protein